MSEFICHNKGRYNLYNTISDGFRFVESISLNQLKHHIEHQYGVTGTKVLDERLNRAHKTGCSSFMSDNLEDVLICNRAGENEVNLLYQECIDRFLS